MKRLANVQMSEMKLNSKRFKGSNYIFKIKILLAMRCVARYSTKFWSVVRAAPKKWRKNPVECLAACLQNSLLTVPSRSWSYKRLFTLILCINSRVFSLEEGWLTPFYLRRVRIGRRTKTMWCRKREWCSETMIVPSVWFRMIQKKVIRNTNGRCH